MDYYSIPLKFDKLMTGKHQEQVDVRKSIHQNIHLMLNAFFLSYRFDPTFGSVLNKYHARTPPQRRSERAWREEMRESIQKNLKGLLQRYETRIKVSDVIIQMMEPKETENEPVVKVKVDIDGMLAIGRKDHFHYPDSEIEEDAQEVFPLMIPVGRK